EELKQTLRAEGIFAEEHKKTLPKYALNIALVTGKEGSVLQDMYSTFRRYNDCQQLTVIPTRVQGVTAENDIVNALLKADKGGFDAVILARGGGSFEDLMPFNSEKVARTLYAMRTPVVSAIGHETDNPISDYAADLRALTPTAAAELLAFNADELREAIFSLLEFCKDNSKEKLDEISSQIAASLNTVFHITKSKLDKKDYELSSKLSAIREKTRNKVTAAEHKIQLLCEKVSALNPMSVLQRGFFAVKKNGKDITGVAALKTGDEINIVARDGEKAAIIK
ncbi:MAG: exodeoxyribonuclease VII large subunit, partial [Christensenellaceae bacterium]|nr:exodeoxyribonuclease VII large subunit [Christensenellaceae bacterium]